MCNEGKIDRILRVIVGVGVIAWGVMNNNWLGAIGLVPLGTALIGWCPLYAILGINTGCKTKED